MILLLLTFILTFLHTSVSLYFFCFNCNTKQEDFLAGAEEGCCGVASVLISFVAVDGGCAPKKDSAAFKIRRISSFVSAAFQFPMLVAICSAIQIVNSPTAWETQQTSIAVLYPVLLLNLCSFVKNVGEAFGGMWY